MAVSRKIHRGFARALIGMPLAVALLALAPIQAGAADIRQGSDVTVAPGETINDDLYAFGGTINVQGTVSGSVIAFGGTITIAGHVTRDVIASGGTITITGKVDGSVRAAGGNLTLSAPVGEDAVVAGGTLNVGSEATIGRDLVAGVGTATVAGPVTRRILASAGTFTLQSKVGGDVTGRFDRLHLESGAQVSGNLDYTSNNEVSKASGATVAGTTTRHIPQDTGVSGGAGAFIGWLRGLIGLFILGLLLILLLPRFSARAAETIERSPWASLGIGAAVLVLTPIAALIIFVIGLLIGGWWIGLLLLAAYVLLLALGYVLAGLLLGRLIFARIGWSRVHLVWALLAGLFVLTVVGLIPLIGWLISLAALLLGAGALLLQGVAGRGSTPTTSNP